MSEGPVLSRPTALPRDSFQHARLQAGNRQWWTRHPMRYDWKDPMEIAPDRLTLDHFREIDSRFFHASYFAQASGQPPFSALFPPDLRQKRVLEIGCGFGSHAQLFAARGAVYTGIDLTEPAVQATTRRLALNGLPGTIIQADAEQLPLGDASVDVVWSWGVIDHTANTRQALGEIARVVRPGGQVRLMVYNRDSLTYWVTTLFVRGVLFGELRRMSAQQLVEKYCDGHFARMYRRLEWARELRRHWHHNRVDVVGNRYEILLPFPGRVRHRILDRASSHILDPVLRRWGSMLFSVSTSAATA